MAAAGRHFERFAGLGGAGYLWSFAAIEGASLIRLTDEREVRPSDGPGGQVDVVLLIEGLGRTGRAVVMARLARPWAPDPPKETVRLVVELIE